MFYTYVLLSLKSKKLYIGSTEDLKQRLKEHNTGIGGKYTSKNKPFKLVFYEAFLTKKDAQTEVLREKIRVSLNHCRIV